MKKRNRKPRNQVVVAAIERGGSGSGAHGKSEKAKRRAEKIALAAPSYDDQN